jgi:two-component system, OmpR family, response regulator QseB
MHILIVEDDMDLGRALLQSLKAEGITSEWVRRAADARVAVDSAVVDCVLLDVSLPDGMGYDLLSDWRRAGLTLAAEDIEQRSGLEHDHRMAVRAPASLVGGVARAAPSEATLRANRGA